MLPESGETLRQSVSMGNSTIWATTMCDVWWCCWSIKGNEDDDSHITWPNGGDKKKNVHKNKEPRWYWYQCEQILPCSSRITVDPHARIAYQQQRMSRGTTTRSGRPQKLPARLPRTRVMKESGIGDRCYFNLQRTRFVCCIHVGAQRIVTITATTTKQW